MVSSYTGPLESPRRPGGTNPAFTGMGFLVPGAGCRVPGSVLGFRVRFQVRGSRVRRYSGLTTRLDKNLEPRTLTWNANLNLEPRTFEPNPEPSNRTPNLEP